MSGPSTMPLCHASSSLHELRRRSPVTRHEVRTPSGTDQMMVVDGTVMWLPSLFQISQELPESSVKMSGSMLPP